MRHRIVRWREYQHYKGRRPPWIKVHKSILSSPDWVMGSDATKLLAIVCMMAAQLDKAGDGSFNSDPIYLKKIASLDAMPCLDELVSSGFIEEITDASIPLPDCKQLVLPSVSVSVSVSDMEGGVGETNEDESVTMAKEFYEMIPVTNKSSVLEFAASFAAKLEWLEANGRGAEKAKIWAEIRNPKRDREVVNTTNKMFKFWPGCGLDTSQPDPAADIEARTLKRLKEQEAQELAKKRSA